MRKIDLTEKKFGKLTVISPCDTRSGGHVMWNVKCDCGTTKIVNGNNLRSGQTKSCGCLTKVGRIGINNPRFIDMVGEKFGELEVISLHGFKNHKSMWNVKCNCGHEKVVTGSYLVSGKIKSCKLCIHSKHKSNAERHFHNKKNSILYIDNDSVYLFALKENEKIKMMFLEIKI